MHKAKPFLGGHLSPRARVVSNANLLCKQVKDNLYTAPSCKLQTHLPLKNKCKNGHSYYNRVLRNFVILLPFHVVIFFAPQPPFSSLLYFCPPHPPPLPRPFLHVRGMPPIPNLNSIERVQSGSLIPPSQPWIFLTDSFFS